MKLVITIILLALFSISLIAKPKQKRITSKITLKYNPVGKIVKFKFNDLTIYTDTTSLFYIFSKNYKANKFSEITNNYHKDFITHEVSEAKNDTITFSEDFPEFKTTEFEWAILHLLIEKKILLYDNNNIVKSISIKTKWGYMSDYVFYKNKKNGKILFKEEIGKYACRLPRI